MTATTTDNQDLTIRLLTEDDMPALGRLAQRDSAAVPALPLLGAELDGGLVAAISLAPGNPQRLADPFVHSREALALLELRAGQLHGDGRRGRLRGLRLPRRRRPAHARGALALSQPGGGSRLLQL